MMNKVILIGRLGQEPTIRYMPNGEAVCNFSVATSEKYTDKNGQRQEATEWHNVTMYRKLAEIAGKYLTKGISCVFPVRNRRAELVLQP